MLGGGIRMKIDFDRELNLCAKEQGFYRKCYGVMGMPLEVFNKCYDIYKQLCEEDLK